MMKDSYTPAQASAVAKLPLKAVNKLIDGHLIRPRMMRRGRETQRLLSSEQLVYLRLEAEGVRLLPLATRREVARTVVSEPDINTIVLSCGSALVIEVKNARREVEQELKRLRKVQRMVVSDPEIMRGTPVFQGTRIPVDLVAEMVAQGATTEEILEGYPALSREHVELAPLYMQAFPRRGRPAQRPWAKQKPVRVTQKRRTVA
ncbi:MAG: DUF433 domain-containing protein [Acidobacteriaceae bacterium]